MPSVKTISELFLPLLALCQPSLTYMVEDRPSSCCSCHTALEPRCGNTEMCCGIGTGFECTQWEYFKYVCYNKRTGEFFIPDKSSRNAYTGAVVYPDGTQGHFEVGDTRGDTTGAVKLRLRNNVEEPEASPYPDEDDLVSTPHPSEPIETDVPEKPEHPGRSVYPVEPGHPKQPSHPNKSEGPGHPQESAHPDKPEETVVPQGSCSCVDTPTDGPHGNETIKTAPGAPEESDIPKTGLPISPPVVTPHSNNYSNGMVSVTYVPYKPSAKETLKGSASLSITTPASTSDTKLTSSKTAKTTSNISTTAVPDAPGVAVTVLAPAGVLVLCILLGLAVVV